MQLFSISLDELNADGTPLLDAQGKPIPTYGQTEIAEFARVFTGYTYASAANPAGPATGKQARYYGAPMIPYPTTATTGHDTARQDAAQRHGPARGPDAAAGHRCGGAQRVHAPEHPPFVGKQLIQRLVTGNPSPAYVARVAAVFNNNGRRSRRHAGGGEGDPARSGSARRREDRGRLRLAEGAGADGDRAPAGAVRHDRRHASRSRSSNLGQRPYFAPTVFNYFMPDAKIPGTSILGPEFGIHTTNSAVGRANLVYTLVYRGFNPDPTIPDVEGTRLFLAPFEAIADNPAAMVSLINQVLAGGQFPAALEPTIVTAVNAITISATPTAAERTEPRPHGRLPDGFVLRLPGAALMNINRRKFLTSTGALTAGALAGNLSTWGVESAEAQA